MGGGVGVGVGGGGCKCGCGWVGGSVGVWEGGVREEGWGVVGREGGGVGEGGWGGRVGHEVWEVFTFRLKMWFSQIRKIILVKIPRSVSITRNTFGSAEQSNEHRMTSQHHDHYTEMPK